MIIIIEIKMGEDRAVGRVLRIGMSVTRAARVRDNSDHNGGEYLMGMRIRRETMTRAGQGAVKKNKGRIQCLLRSNSILLSR